MRAHDWGFIAALAAGLACTGCRDEADSGAGGSADETGEDDDDGDVEGDDDGMGESGADATTFYRDVAPLLAAHCRGCHTAGGIAPFPFATYDDVAPLAGAIAAAVESGSMPPWHVGDDGSCHTYRDSRRLAVEDVATLVAWADAGAPAGDVAEIPEPAELPHLDDVSVTLRSAEPYAASEVVADDYRCFIVDPELATDRFLTAFEVHPGQPSIVHHVVVFSIDTAEEQQKAEALDADAPGPGYPCYGGAGTDGGRSLLVWTPGTGATNYPEDTGLRLFAGRGLVMQVHYFGGGLEDDTSIELTLVDAVEKEALITGTYDASVEIPPGEASWLQTAAIPLPSWDVPLTIHGVYPHMHRYGRTLRVDYDRGDESECLVDVPAYDFAWQQFFFYEEPVVLDPPGGGYFRIGCTYDSRAAKAPIVFGEGTEDEMCIAALYVTY
jgi:hypothetical protein